MKKVFLLLITVLLFNITGICSAEVIYLKGGRTVKGELLGETSYSVKINENGFPKIYYRDEILRIEKDSVTPVATTPSAPVTQQTVPAAKPAASAKKHELVRRLLEANGARDSMNRIFQQLISEAPEETQSQLREVLLADGIIDQLAPIYEKYYTEAELKELITFYSSPAGKKVVQMTPKVMDESLQAASDFFKQRISTLQQPAPVAK